MIKTGKLAVIGDRDSVLAFKAIGADVYSAKNGFEAGDILKELSKGDTAVIFITEQLAAELEETLKKLKTRPYPAVIPIPSAAGSNGFGLSGVKKDVEKAVGVDILFYKD